MMLKKIWLKINQFPKIFNKYTIKITYDCTRNMKLTISIHKKQIVNPKQKQAEFDCKVKNQVISISQCRLFIELINSLEDGYKYYLGLAETTFKERYSNSKSWFNDENSEKSN